MGEFNWEAERKIVENRAIAQHERLHKLYIENRFEFEIERRKMIDEIIENAGTEARKKRLRAMQESWDNKMKKAGSKNNRLVVAQHLFWEHVENIWNPSLKEFSRELWNLIHQ
jgi:hypothetical protein